MSLTSELRNPDSLISVWLRESMRPAAVQAIVGNFNSILARKSPIVINGVDPAIVGTAFDYMFRWMINPLQTHKLVAMQGAYLADRYFTAKYHHSAAEATVSQIVDLGNANLDLRPQCSVVLAWFEGIFRGGRHLDKIESIYQQKDAQSLLNTVPKSEALDISKLAETILSVWGSRINQPYVPNPTFAGSVDVGGADADWILGDTLYDCKTSRKRNPFDVQHFLQIVGYVLLDYDNTYNIQQVGWYFARQQIILEMPINRIFRDLTKSRESLRKCLSERVTS
jgi:hypothetical protein